MVGLFDEFDPDADPELDRACRVCGCTETTPCIDDATGDPCGWAGPDLCTACAEDDQ